MKDYTLILEEMLDKEIYEKLFQNTLENVRKKFGNIKIDKAMEILNVNHQSILIISILKSQNFTDEKIVEILHWKNQKSFKYIVVNNYKDFLKLYGEYISLIVTFIKKEKEE